MCCPVHLSGNGALNITVGKWVATSFWKNFWANLPPLDTQIGFPWANRSVKIN
jgi:hypothetical protein